MRKLGILCTEEFGHIYFRNYFLNFNDFEFIYVYPSKAGNSIREYANKMKISTQEIKTGDMKNDFINSCRKVIELSDVILVLCRNHETKKSIIKIIIKYAEQKNKIVILINEQNKQTFIA